jgi:flagellar basal-body rod protein FlgF
MDNPGYIGLTRMRGLADEMRAVANNIANMATTGFKAEKVVFAEVLIDVETDGGTLAMSEPRAHYTDRSSGGFQQTGGELDLAIDGDGFFQIQTPEGPRLTRAGNFVRDAEGALMTTEGNPVLDPGGAPIAIPPDAAQIAIGRDGIVAADGIPVAQVGLFTAAPTAMVRESGVRFRVTGEIALAADASVLQGFVENSNVNPVEELSRMIEVQRGYELGQTFLDREDERIRDAIRTLGRSA